MARFAARFAALLLGMFVEIAPAPADGHSTPDALALLALLNEARHAAGEPPLIMQPALHAFASAWAAQLSTAQRLSHRSETSQVAWIESNVTPRWKHIGENVAFARSVREAHDVLMTSTIHRANALGDFTHVGIGAARDSTGQLWVAYNFVTAPELAKQERPRVSGGEVSSTPRHPGGAADHAIATVARRGPPAP
jgi:uncharacterized protein YkwD